MPAIHAEQALHSGGWAWSEGRYSPHFVKGRLQAGEAEGLCGAAPGRAVQGMTPLPRPCPARPARAWTERPAPSPPHPHPLARAPHRSSSRGSVPWLLFNLGPGG